MRVFILRPVTVFRLCAYAVPSAQQRSAPSFHCCALIRAGGLAEGWRCCALLGFANSRARVTVPEQKLRRVLQKRAVRVNAIAIWRD